MTYPQTSNFRTATFGDAWWIVVRNNARQLIETAGLSTTVQIQTLLFNGVPTGTRTFDGVTPHQVRIDGVIGPDSLRALWAYGKTVMGVPAAAFAQIQADAVARRLSPETYRIALWLAYNQNRNVDLLEGPVNARRRVRRTDPPILWVQALAGVSLPAGTLLPQWLERPAIPVSTTQSPAPPQVTTLAADGTRTTDVLDVPPEPPPPPEAALVPETTASMAPPPAGTQATPATPATATPATPATTATPTTTPESTATPDSSTPGAPKVATTNYVPWVLGGLAVAAAVGIGIAVMRKKDEHPALGPGAAGAGPGPGVRAGAAPPPHANPANPENWWRDIQMAAWVRAPHISHAERAARIDEMLTVAIKKHDDAADHMVEDVWAAFPEQIIESPLFKKYSHSAAKRL
jgi:hypothetical protein